jgi:hypothetical protein
MDNSKIKSYKNKYKLLVKKNNISIFEIIHKKKIGWIEISSLFHKKAFSMTFLFFLLYSHQIN